MLIINMAFNIHEEIRKNKKQSNFIIFIFFLFVALVTVAVGVIISFWTTSGIDYKVIIISAVVGLFAAVLYLMTFMSNGDKWILSSTGAKPVARDHYPFLFHTVESLCLAGGMKTIPKCYVIQDSALNAYATGFTPEKSYIVVTTGLMKKLNREELEGVIAHELSHIQNRDIKVMLLAAGLVGITVFISDILLHMFWFGGNRSGGGGDSEDNMLNWIMIGVAILLIILSPIVANMLKLAISRTREYLADASGAKLTRYPEGLASALEKISSDPDPLVDKANKATAHLFISTPFRKRSGFMTGMFSTHPPIKERIRILRGKSKTDKKK